MTSTAPLVAHVLYRLDVGGLENGLVNLINHMPPNRYRHAIVCLTDYSDFAKRIQRTDVPIFALQKKPGKDLGCYLRFRQVLRKLRPAIVHTRNLGTLDMQFVAALCGVRARVHGEHGWDVYDLNGQNPKYLRLRRLASRVVHRYIAMSRDLADYLVRDVQVDVSRIAQIYSGVDVGRFKVRDGQARPGYPGSFVPRGGVVIGTVGRMEPVKNTLALARAFGRLVDAVPGGRDYLRLVFVGAGPLQKDLQHLIDRLGIADITWLAGSRNDVADLIRSFDVFVLPSLNEGISNTLLEAMASGVPTIAARVGGNPEVVRDGATGALYSAGSDDELVQVMLRYVMDPVLRSEHGRRAREVVEESHSLTSMVNGYMQVYDRLVAVTA